MKKNLIPRSHHSTQIMNHFLGAIYSHFNVTCTGICQNITLHNKNIGYMHIKTKQKLNFFFNNTFKCNNSQFKSHTCILDVTFSVQLSNTDPRCILNQYLKNIVCLSNPKVWAVPSSSLD